MVKRATFHEIFTIAVSKGVTMGSATAIVNEVEKRAGEIISKADKPITKAEAYARIFQADPALYAKYRGAQQIDIGAQPVITKADGSTTAPSFGTEVLRRQLDGLYDLTSALMSTLAGIVSSEAGDKGPFIQRALDDFTSAMRTAFAQAGIAVPVAKALIPPTLEAELLRTLMQVAPRDPTGHGATILAKALQQLRQDLAA
jgi:hypothetical protein